MPSLTNFPLPGGLNVPGLGIAPLAYGPRGALLFVNSTLGSDSSSRLQYIGSTTGSVAGSRLGPQGKPDNPLASVFGTNGALSFTQANRGDIIIVDGAHTESLGTNGSYAILAGVTIIGVGGRNSRPTFTLTGGTSTVITPGANVTIQNCNFISGVSSLVKMFNMTGAAASLVGCKITQGVTALIALNGATIAAADISFIGCEFDALITGAATAIAAGAASAKLRVINCEIRGFFSTALIGSTSTFHLTSMAIIGNILYQSNATAKVIFDLTTSSTGMIANNVLGSLSAATNPAGLIANSTSTSLIWILNYGSDLLTALGSGLLTPAAGTFT